MSHILCLIALALFPLPFFLALARAGRPLDDNLDDLAFACGAALAALWLSTNLSLVSFGALWAAVLAFGLYRCRGLRFAPGGPEEKALLLCTAAVAALRAAPLFVNPYPLGWDPYFHMILADGIASAGRIITTWEPYETVRVNYPLASHMLVALTSRATGAPIHAAFTAAQVFFGVLLPLQLYSLAVKTFGDRQLALLTSLVFATWAVYGGLAYFQWGGLPNLCGLYLLLAALSFLAAPPEAGAAARWRVPVCVVALSFAHHHVMFTAFLVLTWLWAWARFVRLDVALAGRLARETGKSLLLGAPYFALYLARVPTLSRTGAVDYIEPLITPARYLEYFGPLFTAALLAGAAYWLARKPRAREAGLWLQTALALVAAFAAIDYAYRGLSWLLVGKESAPLAPARFLTDAIPLLCVFPAYGALALGRRLRLRALSAGAAVLAVGALNGGVYLSFFRAQVPPERVAAYDWIREHTREDAVVLDRFVETSYFTKRVSNTFPLTPSEFFADATILPATKELLAGRMPELFQHRQIVGISYSPEVRGKILRRIDGGITLLDLNPAAPVGL